jgi:hypothetical protein
VPILFTPLANGFRKTEPAIPFRARFLAWLGVDYSRTGTLPGGRSYRETFYANGMRYRCETGPKGTVCEWTDTSGAWNRIETRATRRGPR